MMMLRRNTKIYYAVSLMLHAALLLLMMMCFQLSADEKIMGNNVVQIVNSYLMKMPVEKMAHQVIEKRQDNRLKLKKAIEQKQETAQEKMVSTSASANSRGEHNDELVGLLHAAIQRQQHYPASAMDMERQGSVLVRFTLLTNGGVQGLQVARSSGTDSLDQAALAAVQAAVPFSNIERYLQAAKDFSIEVVFELS